MQVGIHSGSVMQEQGQASAFEGWWRWPLVPLAAPLGATAGAVAFVLLQWLGMKLHGGMSEDGWFFLYILPVIQSAIFGYLYSTISCAVAPRAKLVTGVVMVTLLGALVVVVLVFGWATSEGRTGDAVQATVQTVAAMVAAIAALVSFREEHGWV